MWWCCCWYVNYKNKRIQLCLCMLFWVSLSSLFSLSLLCVSVQCQWWVARWWREREQNSKLAWHVHSAINSSARPQPYPNAFIPVSTSLSHSVFCFSCWYNFMSFWIWFHVLCSFPWHEFFWYILYMWQGINFPRKSWKIVILLAQWLWVYRFDCALRKSYFWIIVSHIHVDIIIR